MYIYIYIYIYSEVKIAFIIAHAEITEFVWNSQGAVFYSHRSE